MNIIFLFFRVCKLKMDNNDQFCEFRILFTSVVTQIAHYSLEPNANTSHDKDDIKRALIQTEE